MAGSDSRANRLKFEPPHVGSYIGFDYSNALQSPILPLSNFKSQVPVSVRLRFQVQSRSSPPLNFQISNPRLSPAPLPGPRPHPSPSQISNLKSPYQSCSASRSKAAAAPASTQTPRLEAARKSSITLAGALKNCFCAAVMALRKFSPSRKSRR